ncbi:exo-alpha-sialidase [Pleomorphovibrio marinus]|uniref:exo-alpha-sialidase n=1 Tax=Pleomorphovibrio marinus TaxID=2164132 RepID=UPI00130067AF|nr:sialidase family protein [Pleomorphovibrio marinus]
MKTLLYTFLSISFITFSCQRPQNIQESHEDSSFFYTQELFKGRGGRSIVAARDGTIIAFNGNEIRKSKDGITWTDVEDIGEEAKGTNAILNEENGDILLLNPKGYVLKSSDHGSTWRKEDITILPDAFGLGSPEHVPVIVWASQSGTTLAHGPEKGRLLMPARILGPTNSNEEEWRPYHYNTALYSDDGGKVWQVSAPFPVMGTGESALTELSDGSVYYSSREHMTKGNRFVAWSHDGGATWLNAYRCPYLPDGPKESSYGCMGGVIRLPLEGKDILIYSNLDSDKGKMPELVGGTIENDRENISVWASLDGGITWSAKRSVYSGPSAYSNLGVGRPGTALEGKIFLLYEGGKEHMYEGVHVAVFDLAWVLEKED